MADERARRAAARRARLGREGECAVAAALAADGYEVLGRNVRVGRDEIDVLARRGGVLHVVEVKTRTSSRWGGAESVTPDKLARLRRAASRWLAESGPGGGVREVRVDVWVLTPAGDAFAYERYRAVA
ncbi:YraN family protein [Corynebacterium sp.]|uniref:YraN family protein n=1 Tax=Corynebacterium sp. TaxID=1720 RepID=UPI0026DC8478|nr:YraN family protein [Corynebacterium sp.]MDO4610907.1 YraN family protein [Corynebacterium sp.]